MTTSAFVETSAVIGPFWAFATLLLFAPCYSVKYHKNLANTEPQRPSLVEKKNMVERRWFVLGVLKTSQSLDFVLMFSGREFQGLQWKQVYTRKIFNISSSKRVDRCTQS